VTRLARLVEQKLKIQTWKKTKKLGVRNNLESFPLESVYKETSEINAKIDHWTRVLMSGTFYGGGECGGQTARGSLRRQRWQRRRRRPPN